MTIAVYAGTFDPFTTGHLFIVRRAATLFGDYFAHLPLNEDSEVAFGPFSISCRRTIHHVPTTAIRIRAGGRSLAYSADTTFDHRLIDWLSESELVLHETGYGIHTPYSQLETLPASLRAKMKLVHYPDELVPDPEILQALSEGMLVEI